MLYGVRNIFKSNNFTYKPVKPYTPDEFVKLRITPKLRNKYTWTK